jgi:hypothetical protein
LDDEYTSALLALDESLLLFSDMLALLLFMPRLHAPSLPMSMLVLKGSLFAFELSLINIEFVFGALGGALQPLFSLSRADVLETELAKSRSGSQLSKFSRFEQIRGPRGISVTVCGSSFVLH